MTEKEKRLLWALILEAFSSGEELAESAIALISIVARVPLTLEREEYTYPETTQPKEVDGTAKGFHDG